MFIRVWKYIFNENVDTKNQFSIRKFIAISQTLITLILEVSYAFFGTAVPGVTLPLTILVWTFYFGKKGLRSPEKILEKIRAIIKEKSHGKSR